MRTEQNKVPASVNMDARNFLRAINNSAQSKVAFFENVVSKFGAEAGKNYKLAALHPTFLIFEDVATHDYFTGDIKKEGVRFVVENIKKLNIIEEKKADLFDKNCSELIDALSEENFKDAEKAFSKIETQRFRSKVIPESGYVSTRDGEVRKINLAETKKPNLNNQIVEAFVSAVSNSVELCEGKVIRGTFLSTGDKIELPVNEDLRRRVVARKMRSVAMEATNSENFRKFVKAVAANVSKSSIKEAVELAAKFLSEEQEFCLLSSTDLKNLVESSLAMEMEFNPLLIQDVTTLLHRTNMKVNKDEIVNCWTKCAQKSSNSAMMNDIKGIAESADFGKSYNLFLESVFCESGDVNSNRAKAYLVTLKVMKNILSHMPDKAELVSEIGSLISGLEVDEPATDMVFKVEELLANLDSELVSRVDNLGNFDSMPGVDSSEPADEMPADNSQPEELPDFEDLEAPEGELEAVASEAPAEAPAEPKPELPESKENKNQIVEGKVVAIEDMSTADLKDELDTWKTYGHVYLKEDGAKDCLEQMSSYIKRCVALNATDLRESFENMRDTIVTTGNDVVAETKKDKYNVEVADTKIDDYCPLSEDLGGLSAPAKGPKHGSDASGMSELQDGEGLADKKTKEAGPDGGVPAAPGHVKGETSMAKDHQDKSKGLADKAVKTSDPVKAAPGHVKGETSMAKDHQDKSKGVAESFVDRIAGMIDESDKLDLGVKNNPSGYKKSHDLDMAKEVGDNGVADDKVTEVKGNDAKGAPTATGAPKGDVNMAKDHQDKTDGLAEERKEEEKGLSEDVAVAYSSDERLDDVISKVIDAMSCKDEPMAMPSMPLDMPSADVMPSDLPPVDMPVAQDMPELPEMADDEGEDEGEEKDEVKEESKAESKETVKEEKDICGKCNVVCGDCKCSDCSCCDKCNHAKCVC